MLHKTLNEYIQKEFVIKVYIFTYPTIAISLTLGTD